MRVSYPAFDRAELVRRLREGLQRLADELPVTSAVLFGSWARGAQDAASDVDLLVVYRDPARADAWTRVKQAVAVPRLEPHVYAESEHQALRATLDRMAEGGISLLDPDAGSGGSPGRTSTRPVPPAGG